MRLASFAIPYSGGTGDLSVIQLGGDGGGLKSNVNRWRGQLNLEPMSLIEIEKDIVKEEGQLNIYSIIQIINQEMDSAFLCAIIPTGNYTIFVKLSLKPNGIIVGICHDEEHFLSKFLKNKHPIINDEHNYVFGKKTLKKIFN